MCQIKNPFEMCWCRSGVAAEPSVCCRSPCFPSNRMRWLWGCLYTTHKLLRSCFSHGETWWMTDPASLSALCRAAPGSTAVPLSKSSSYGGRHMRRMKWRGGGKTQPPLMQLFLLFVGPSVWRVLDLIKIPAATIKQSATSVTREAPSLRRG